MFPVSYPRPIVQQMNQQFDDQDMRQQSALQVAQKQVYPMHQPQDNRREVVEQQNQPQQSHQRPSHQPQLPDNQLQQDNKPLTVCQLEQRELLHKVRDLQRQPENHQQQHQDNKRPQQNQQQQLQVNQGQMKQEFHEQIEGISSSQQPESHPVGPKNLGYFDQQLYLANRILDMHIRLL